MGDRIFVIGNYSYRENIPIGSEIVSINGVPSKEVIEKVSRLIRYESIAFRDYSLSLPTYINMWNNYRDYTIEYKDPSSTLRTIKTGGSLYAKIQFNNEVMKGHSEPYYEFAILPGNIGYLGFYQFHEINEFKSFLANAFQQIRDRRIKNLIIDIRSNPGGNSALGDELLQYISPRPFKQYEKELIKISREVQTDKHEDWMKDHAPGSVVEAGDTAAVPLRENPLRFSGNCFLLVGGGTFSAAADFASSFRCYTGGKIVGTETGGVTVCCGELYDFSLPASGIRMGVSSKKFYNVCGVDNRRGVVPRLCRRKHVFRLQEEYR